MNITYRPIGADWPGQRTQARQYARFVRHGRYVEGEGYKPGTKVPWGDTLRLLEHELDELEADDMVLQIDVREDQISSRSGMPRADARIRDPAVIISFKSKHGPLRYFCDQFTDWQDNVRAIALGLEALRKVERYGITHRGEQYAGWKALPPSSGTVEGAIFRFGGPEDAARFIMKLAGDHASLQAMREDKIYRDEVFKRAAKKAHPDTGGNRNDWDNLVEARRVLEGTAK